MTSQTLRENAAFWAALDDYVHQAWPALRQLLDVVYQYRDELDPQMNAILFGGIGKFHLTYDTCRSAGFDEQDSFGAALEAFQNDRRIQAMQQQAVESFVDERTTGLEGME